MMIASIPGPTGYNPNPPPANVWSGPPPLVANPEYSAWQQPTAVTTPHSYNASQANNAETYAYAPSYRIDDSVWAYAYDPTAIQNNSTQSTLNQYDGRSYAYNPTANTATQNTQNNNSLEQYLSQIDNRQLNQAQYTHNTALDVKNNLSNLLVYYNPVTHSYNLPPVPPQPVPPQPIPPEPPKKENKGGFWKFILPLVGLAAVALPFLFRGKKDKPPETPPVHVPPETHEPPHPPIPETPPVHVPPETPEPPHPPTTVHGTGTGGVFDDPKYYNGDRSNYFENHTTGNLTYFADASDRVHSEIKVSQSKVKEAGTGNQLTFVEEAKFQNDGKTVKVTSTKVYIGTKAFDIKGEGSADLGHNGKVTWHNGTVTIETAEGKHVIKTKKFQMQENITAYGPSYLEIDSTSTSKQLDVSGVVGDGMNAQLAGLGSPKKPLRSFDGFVNAKPEALTKEQMERILGQPSSPTAEPFSLLW